MKRLERLAKARLRSKRIRRVSSQLPRKKWRMHKVVIQGLRPSMDYGARVTGASDAELLLMRRALHGLLPPLIAGASLTAQMLLHGDAAWPAALAPIRAWCEEIWRAACGMGLKAFNFKELRNLWQDARPNLATSWRACKGPSPSTACGAWSRGGPASSGRPGRCRVSSPGA